jgi:DNA-binding response OmpR family regulator
MDGIKATKEIRKIPANAKTPIIAMTAYALAEDREKFLQAGMDDYIAKPFSPRELMARIKALLRRAEFRQPEKEVVSGRKLKFAGWTLDSRTQLLTHEDGSSIDLTGSDFILLHLFLQHPGQILDRDAISDATRGRESLPMERGIDVQISRLRQKLGDNGKGPRIIKTIRGSGYMLIADVVHED